MYEKRKTASRIITISAVTMFFLVIISLVVFTAGSYRFANSTADSNRNTRAVLSYIVNCVRDSGAADVSVSTRSGKECLVISTGDGFEQRFYINDEKLMEEYTQANAELRPSDALTVGETAKLELKIDDKGMLTIRTDGGCTCVSIVKHGK